MYFTKLVKSTEIPDFDINKLSESEAYVFIVLPSDELCEWAYNLVGSRLAACKHLCFLLSTSDIDNKINQHSLLKSIFQKAIKSVPDKALSYIIVIQKEDLLRNEYKGTFIELFLLLESEENREEKLEQALHKVLNEEPKLFQILNHDFLKLIIFLYKVLKYFLLK